MSTVPELTAQEQEMYTTAQTGRFGMYKMNHDEIDDLVLRCGACGYSRAQMAACIGISKETLQAWLKDYPQFREVMLRAQTLAQSWWEGRAQDGTANALIGASIWSRSMAARFPSEYTERQETGSMGEAEKIEEVRWSVVRPEPRKGPEGE